MRWKQALAGIGIILFATTACGQQPANTAGAGPGSRDGGSLPSRDPVLSRSGQVEQGEIPGEVQPAPPVEGMPGRKPAQPPAGGDGTPVPAERIDGSALPEGHPRQVSVHGDGRRLSVTAQEGGCGRASVEVAGQTGRHVALTLVETEPAGQRACTMDMRYPVLTVRLDQPLADREVVLSSEQRRG
ncbi:hypothetical protein [Qaidamihabitans albus]|uniref:hypothetical protein n=1 Tax=Qaidamihabitans albus TaxID=2795733 RepID=UPI0018F19FE5|nr:hypothetical protein [Qaidamihabitans albus]